MMEVESLPSPRQPGFQTFVMTGDAMIQVTKSPEKETPRSSLGSNDPQENTHEDNNTNPDSVQVVISTSHDPDSNNENHSANGHAAHENPGLNGGLHVPGDNEDLHISSDNEQENSSCRGTSPGHHNDSGGSLSSLGSLDDISLDMNNPKISTSHVDEPSAARLAKHLFYLEGFKKSDVAYHLTKNNQFAQRVTEEYLRYFDFAGLNLVESMRKFFQQFALVGETQERERVLHHFTIRYLECNTSVLHRDYASQDACHTLTCALMLLNTDLHGQNIGRKMTLHDFTENLSGLNGDINFPKDLLKTYYNSVKHQPFHWATNEDFSKTKKHTTDASGQDREETMPNDLVPTDHPIIPQETPSFITVPTSENTTEYKRGILLKKHCKGADGVPMGSGKRGWKKHYVIMRDMVLHLLKPSEEVLQEGGFKVILLHHSLAQVARLYKKKPFVFSLKTADWSEYLFSTTSADELEDWVNTINLVSAALSSEPLAAGVGSQKKFHRPLLPSAHTRLPLSEQVKAHEERVLQLRQSITEEENDVPNSKLSSKLILSNYKEKLEHLKYELQRYVIYTELLRDKLLSYPDLEATMVNTSIGEVDESETGQGVAPSDHTNGQTLTTTLLTNRSPANSIDNTASGTTPAYQTEGMYINLEDEITGL